MDFDINKKIESRHTDNEWEEVKKEHGHKCAHCGITEYQLSKIFNKPKYHKLVKDHITPLEALVDVPIRHYNISPRKRSYLTKKENLQPLCFFCNSRKSVMFDSLFDHRFHLWRGERIVEYANELLGDNKICKIYYKKDMRNYLAKKYPYLERSYLKPIVDQFMRLGENIS